MWAGQACGERTAWKEALSAVPADDRPPLYTKVPPTPAKDAARLVKSVWVESALVQSLLVKSGEI